MKNRKCKGMQDLLPADMWRFRYIEDAFRSCCLKWGYQEVRTPTLEYLHLFTATGTISPSMLNKVYSFLDWDGWSGERVVLRPDGTIPIARLYINNLGEHEIAKLFYVTNIFAFGETGRENRERWQCGVEFLGGGKPAADVEIVLLAKDVMRKIGFDNVELQLSHAGLVRALIKELKLSPGEETKVTSRVLDGDWQALIEAKSTNPDLEEVLSPLMSLKGKSSGFLQNVRALSQQASPGFKSNLEDFAGITALLDGLGCSYQIDITAIRNFEYYTGVCFRLLGGGVEMGGGGRYDNLIPLMNGENVPACGFALYVDPMMKWLPLGSKERPESQVLIQSEELTTEAVRTCFTLAQSLRDAGCIVKLGFSSGEESDYRWVISVAGKKPSTFVIIDRQKNQKRDVASVSEILSVLAG